MRRGSIPIEVTDEMLMLLDELTEVDDQTGCWNWTGYINATGYGRRSFNGGKNYLAHRASYTRHKGPIPEGLEIDHLCRNRKCVNPEHLEPVTSQTNTLRGMAPGAIAQRRDACKRGHLYSEYGKVWGVRRYCTACSAINVKAYRERKAAASHSFHDAELSFRPTSVEAA